jgi:hypothetical protein
MSLKNKFSHLFNHWMNEDAQSRIKQNKIKTLKNFKN